MNESELDELLEWVQSRIGIFSEPKTKTEIGGNMVLLAVRDEIRNIQQRRPPVPANTEHSIGVADEKFLEKHGG
jgi:hypothetical protein